MPPKARKRRPKEQLDRAALDGREFDGNVVRASFVSTAAFEKTQKRAARAEEKNAPAKYKSSSRARAAEKNKNER